MRRAGYDGGSVCVLVRRISSMERRVASSGVHRRICLGLLQLALSDHETPTHLTIGQYASIHYATFGRDHSRSVVSEGICITTIDSQT